MKSMTNTLFYWGLLIVATASLMFYIGHEEIGFVSVALIAVMALKAHYDIGKLFDRLLYEERRLDAIIGMLNEVREGLPEDKRNELNLKIARYYGEEND